MWFRYTLSNARTFLSVASAETCKQCGNRGKIITPTKSVQRLFSTNVQCPTVGEVIEQWSERFKNESIPEPVESIEHIVAHILGTRKVLHELNVQFIHYIHLFFYFLLFFINRLLRSSAGLCSFQDTWFIDLVMIIYYKGK